MSINPKAIRGPVTAVPVVAGKGIKFVEDVENNRVVAEVDETVLWTGSEVMNDNGTIPLSETVNNFEAIEVYGKVWSTWNEVLFIRITVNSTMTTQQTSVAVSNLGASGAAIRFNQCQLTLNGTSIKISNATQFSIQGTAVSTGNASAVIDKIVGINRIANN